MGFFKKMVAAIHESARLHHLERDRETKQKPQNELATLQDQAGAHVSAGRFDEAIVCYDALLAADPRSVRSWNCKGNSLFNLKKYEEALACYEQALVLEPTDPRIWNNKGLTQDMLGYPMDALKSFDAAIALDPGIERVWQNKGKTLSRLGWVEESRRCLKQAKDLRGKRDAAGTAT